MIRSYSMLHALGQMRASNSQQRRVLSDSQLIVLLTTVCLTNLGVPVAIGQQPVGGEFLVNSYTSSNQIYPAVAMAQDGDFIVVWQGNGPDGNDTYAWGIQGQRFGSGGHYKGDSFQVNSYTTMNQTRPAVIVDSNGGSVAVWASQGSSFSDTSKSSIQGQRYAANGRTLGAQFQVNSYTHSFQYNASVAVAPDAGFFVVWKSDGSAYGDTSGWSIQGQRYFSDGRTRGSQFQVNSHTPHDQENPSVAATPNGGFVVAWQSIDATGPAGSYWHIQGQRYFSDGRPQGSQFEINSYTSGMAIEPAIAAAPNNSFVVAWQSFSSAPSDTSGWSIQGQRYHSNGRTSGAQFLVNSYTSGDQKAPTVVVAPGGDFLVAWQSAGSTDGDTSGLSVQAQRYHSNGRPNGSQFLVNTYTPHDQSRPKAAVASNGDFVVVWQNSVSASSAYAITSLKAQRFRESHISRPSSAGAHSTHPSKNR